MDYRQNYIAILNHAKDEVKLGLRPKSKISKKDTESFLNHLGWFKP